MDLGVLEHKLRALPGVLDCSVSAEGVAVVVHPEVDPRLIELQAQVVLAEAGDRRPLLVVGGMTMGPPMVPPTGSSRRPGRERARRIGPSPLSLVVLALLVLGLLAVVPVAGRDGGPDRAAAPSSGRSAGVGRVPVEEAGDEIVLAVGGPAVEEAAVEPVPPAPAPVPEPRPEPARVVAASVAVPPPAPAAVPVVTSSPAAGDVAAPGKRKGQGRGAKEVRAAGGRGKAEVVAMASPPGTGEPPGRRRGHDR